MNEWMNKLGFFLIYLIFENLFFTPASKLLDETNEVNFRHQNCPASELKGSIVSVR